MTTLLPNDDLPPPPATARDALAWVTERKQDARSARPPWRRRGRRPNGLRDLAGKLVEVARAHWAFRHATTIGRFVRLRGRARVRCVGEMVLGERVRIDSTIARTELVSGPEALLSIGARTYINYGTSIGALDAVIIGDDCNIGTHCTIIDNAFHSLSPEARHELPASAPIIIGDNVWIAGRVTILPGVTIGEGSVIAAGAVLNVDVPPRTLMAGVPARPVRPV